MPVRVRCYAAHRSGVSKFLSVHVPHPSWMGEARGSGETNDALFCTGLLHSQLEPHHMRPVPGRWVQPGSQTLSHNLGISGKTQSASHHQVAERDTDPSASMAWREFNRSSP